MMKSILIVEDHVDINTMISNALKGEGYQVFSTYDAFHALDVFHKEDIDLIVTDLMLPIKSGESFIREVREESMVHMIVVSAKSSIEDKLEGLKLGADDYLVKPFSKEELLVKIGNYFKKQEGKENILRIYDGQIVFSFDRNVLLVKGKEVTLTAVEFQLLKFLFQHKNQVVSRNQLLDAIYNYESEVYDRVVDTHIKNIRKKVKALYDVPFIKTIYGLGYMLVGGKDA